MEGAAISHKKEFIQFLYVSMGSVAELETQVLISKNLNYLNQSQFNILNTKLTEIRNMLTGLIKSFSK